MPAPKLLKAEWASYAAKEPENDIDAVEKRLLKGSGDANVL